MRSSNECLCGLRTSFPILIPPSPVTIFMPRIGRTTTGEWHFLGECSCGNFEYQDLVIEEAFDETAYDGTPDPRTDNPEAEGPPFGDYRDFCRRCYSRIETWEQRRASRIEALFEAHDFTETSWERSEQDPRKQALPDCGICGKPESGSHYNEAIDCHGCDACRMAFNEAVEHHREDHTVNSSTGTKPSVTADNASATFASEDSSSTVSRADTDRSEAESDIRTGDQQDESSSPVADSETPSEGSDTEISNPQAGSTAEVNTTAIGKNEHRSSTPPAEVDSTPSLASDTASSSETQTGSPPQSGTGNTHPGSLEDLRSVSGVGPAVVESLRTNEYHSLADVASASPADLAELPRIGATLSERLIDAAENPSAPDRASESSEAPIEDLLEISGVGKGVITTLREHGYTSRKAVIAASSDELRRLPNIGETVADRLTEQR